MRATVVPNDADDGGVGEITMLAPAMPTASERGHHAK